MVEPAFGQIRIRVEACGVCHTDALAPRGQLIVAGAGGNEPIEVDPVPLLFGMRSIAGTMTGGKVSLLGGFAWIPHLLADASQHVEKTIVTFKYGVCSIVSLNRNPC